MSTIEQLGNKRSGIQHSARVPHEASVSGDLIQPSTAAGFDEVLRQSKLLIPPPANGMVSRAALIDRARGNGCRVVGVVAPAGYGKSTLLSEWAQTEERPVAWVSLDRFDDDPAVLLMLLASAYGRISPHEVHLTEEMCGLGVSVLGRAAPRLASALRASASPFVLMLDDFQELRTSACHDVMEVVISGIPPGSQLVAASRCDQPHIPRLRAARDAMEIRVPDLALDAAGAAQIFAQAQVTLTDEAAASITERTEGWPVGLYLAALVTQSDDGHAIAVSGEDRYVADYLYRESVMHLSESTQHFLRHTAVLDQISAPLCDALLGESDSQERLRSLEASNSFLIPLDRDRQWYRYHALFREFLIGELRRAGSEYIMKLHLRAADWYEANGSPATAIEHLLNTTERDRCVQLAAQLILPTYEAGDISTVQRWLAAFGTSTIESYPPLAVLAGWVSALTGQAAEAQRWSAIVDAASFDLVPADGSASFDSARAMLRALMCGGGPEAMMRDANLAIRMEAPWSPWRDTAVCLSAESYLLGGNAERAAELFAEASALAADAGNPDSRVLSEAELALLAMDRGRWAEAAGHVETALAEVDRHRMHDYATSLLAFVEAARLAVHRSDMAEASRQLTRAMRARPSCTYALPFIAVRTRLQLAKVYWSIGDQATAGHLLREIDDVLLRRPALGALVDEVAAFRAIVTSRRQPTAVGRSPLTPAELRLLPYLQTHLTIREIAERLFVSRNTVNSELGSIYRKLGVSSRSAAVHHATTAGLLGG